MSNTLPDLAFIDTETTGLNPIEGARVIEVGVCRLPPNPALWPTQPECKVFRFSLGERDHWYASPKALEVNGFHPEHPDWIDTPRLDTNAARAIWSSISPLLEDAVLVSQNVPFDRVFLECEYQLHKLPQPKWARRAVDLQSYSFLIAQQHGLPRWGLHDVYAALGLPALQEHRAVADIRRGLAVFRHVHSAFNLRPQT